MKDHYCYTCGTRTIDTQIIYGYDEDTGKPLVYYHYKCPNQTWWNFLWHDVVYVSDVY